MHMCATGRFKIGSGRDYHGLRARPSWSRVSLSYCLAPPSHSTETSASCIVRFNYHR